MEVKRYCPKPFEHLELHGDGKAYLCCPSYINHRDVGPYAVETLDQVWNSPLAQDFRRSIIDGSYKYCDPQKCPKISEGELQALEELKPEIRDAIVTENTTVTNPSVVMLVNDLSCNLSCPSCRSTKLSFSAGSEKQLKKEQETRQIITKILERSTSKVVINITGSGDPFGSVSYKNILEELDGQLHPNLGIELQTNGVLLTERTWERLSKIHKNIRLISISVDAAKRGTYDVLRRGGSWEKLLQNIDFISRQKNVHKFRLELNFVVQQKNVDQIVDFVKLFRRQAVDNFQFFTINDWGSMSARDFAAANVWEPSHPDHLALVKQVVHPFMDEKPITWGTLYPIREKNLGKRGEFYSKKEIILAKLESLVWAFSQLREYPEITLMKLHFWTITGIRSLGKRLAQNNRRELASYMYKLSGSLTRDDFEDNFYLSHYYEEKGQLRLALDCMQEMNKKYTRRFRTLGHIELLGRVVLLANKLGAHEVRRQAEAEIAAIKATDPEAT